MKKSVLMPLITILFAGLLVNCAKDKTSEDSKPTSASETKTDDNQGVLPNTNENLKYFGFFHSDGWRSQGSQIEKICELDMTNLVMLNSAWTAEVTNERLAVAKSHGQVATIGVPGLFSGGQITVPNSATLREDYKEKIDEYTNSIRSYLEDGTILGFYFDEPAWNGISEEDFRKVTKYLREKWPNVRTMQAMTSYDIGVGKFEGFPEANPSYNEYVTDVMYDNYADWNDKTRKQYLELLKSKATNNQAIWGIPKGFADNPEQPGQIIESLKGIYREALSEPRYAGILSFSWCDGFEGDWSYGMQSFLLEDSDFFSREVLEVYTDIGREVIGKEKIDWDKVPQITLVAPSEVYELGEKVPLPTVGALDGKGNDIDFELSLTSPSGKEMEVEDFIAEEPGNYIFKIVVNTENGKREKSCPICVRVENEISLFDTPAYSLDAGGSGDDIWCWPREVTTDFARTGTGSLKVIPHATDGTWPCVAFQRNGYRLWDFSKHSGMSMWVYNPSDKPLENFGIIICDENENKALEVIKLFTIEPKKWQELTIDTSFIKRNQPTLDLTKLIVKFGNCASDYKNRTVFYIDDVMFYDNPNEEVYEFDEKLINFEHEDEIIRIGGSGDDVWCWPRQISDEMAHDGTKSLLVTPNPTDGTWPRIVFLSATESTIDISKIEGISLWIYNPSDTVIQNFGLVTRNGNDKTTETIKTFNIEPKKWQELTLTCAEIKENQPNFDFKHATIYLGNCGSDYLNRTKFYLDDFSLYGEGNWEPDTPIVVNPYDASTLAEVKTYLNQNLNAYISADKYDKYTECYFKGSKTDLSPSSANEWMGIDSDRMKLGTNADDTAGVDEIRAEYTVSKDGYVLARQILLGWFKYENVTVDFYLNDTNNKFASQTLTIDGNSWYSYTGATKASKGDKIIVVIKYHAANGEVANIVNKGLSIAECATEGEFDLPEGYASFDAYCRG